MKKCPFSRPEKILLVIAALVMLVSVGGLIRFYMATPELAGPDGLMPSRWIAKAWVILLFSAVLTCLFVLFRPKRFQPPELDFPRALPDLVPDEKWWMQRQSAWGQLLGVVSLLGVGIWMLAQERCEIGFSCWPRHAPVDVVMMLALGSMSETILRRLYALVRPCSPTLALNLSNSASPSLGERIKELGGIYDYEAHVPRSTNGQATPNPPPAFVLLTRDALLIVHFEAFGFSRREVQEFILDGGVTMSRSSTSNQWHINGTSGSIFELHCTNAGGQRLAETLNFLQHSVRPQIRGLARWLPAWPGSLVRLREVLILTAAPILWLVGTGLWFSLVLVLSLMPMLALLIDHYRLTLAYNNRAFTPLTAR